MEEGKRFDSRVIGIALVLCAALCIAFGTARPAQAAALDKDNLLQGTYTAQATMVNASSETGQTSIADQALVKPITISVSASHAYTAELGMQPITMMGATAYMQSLSYWDGAQYRLSTVTSSYALTDAYGSVNPPQTLSFPLLNKAAGDEGGYVRLQVDVPIIAAMSGGRAPSTQNVNLKIDWATLKQTKALETVSGGVSYAVSGKAATVTSIANKAKSASVKSTVKIGGTSYKVTSIKAKAAYKAKNLKKVALGKNLKSIGKNAFKGIARNATFTCPKSKLKSYKKLVKAAGAPSTAKFKAV